MKKSVSLILVLCMILLLVGCNSENVPDKDPEPTRGVIEGDIYTNEYLGFTFTKQESWIYSTDEEIAALMNIGAEMLGEKFTEALKNNPTVYDMMAIDTLTGSSVNIGYENLSKTFSSNITVEQYIEVLKNQISSIATSGIAITFPDEFDVVTFGDTDFTRVIATTSMNGFSLTQVYYLNKADGFMRFIIVTAMDNNIERIEAMFE